MGKRRTLLRELEYWLFILPVCLTIVGGAAWLVLGY